MAKYLLILLFVTVLIVETLSFGLLGYSDDTEDDDYRHQKKKKQDIGEILIFVRLQIMQIIL